MELYSYPAVFQQHDGQVEVDFPDVPEAFTQGKDMEAAIEMAKLGLAITLNDRLGHFETVPEVSDLAAVRAKFPQAIVKIVTVDLEEYQLRFTKLIARTV